MKRGILLFASLFIVLSACSQQQATSTSSVETTFIFTPSITLTPSFTATPTNSPSPTPTFTSAKSLLATLGSAFTELPKGTYLTLISLEEGQLQYESNNRVILDIFNTDGWQKTRSIEVPNGAYFSTAAGTGFYGFPYREPQDFAVPLMDFSRSFFFDLNGVQEQDLSSKFLLNQNCLDVAAGPDNNKLIVSCLDDRSTDFSYDSVRLYILSADQEKPIQITNCGEEYLVWCYAPNWSSDGKWIAYSKGSQQSGTHPEDGIYEARIICPELSSSCVKTVIGPLKDGYLANFSPDGALIAIPNSKSIENGIDIYRTGQNHPMKTIETGPSMSVRKVSWSPDGSELALLSSDVDENQVYVISLDDANPQPIYVGKAIDLSGWIIKP